MTISNVPTVGAARGAVAGRRIGVFGLALVAVLVVLGAILAGRASATDAESGSYKVVRVQPGETLSAIAVRELPGERASQAVVDLRLVNNLASDHIAPGESLLIPRHS